MIGNTSTIGSNRAYASGNLPIKRLIDNIGSPPINVKFFGFVNPKLVSFVKNQIIAISSYSVF